MEKAVRQVVLDPAFPHAYEVEPTVCTNHALRVHGGRGSTRIGVVAANGEAFALAVALPGAQPRVELATWFDPNFFLVLDTGELIDTLAPHARVKLAALEGHRVNNHLLLADHRLAVLVFCGGILCYSPSGLLWTITAKVCGSEPIIDTFASELFVILRDRENGNMRRLRFGLRSGDWLGEAPVI
jgi:hypothetical protein